MQLSGVTIALRPRTPWEAADLGIALVRQHARTLWSAWFIMTLPVVLGAIVLILVTGVAWTGTLVLWWFKPLFDRIPLFVLSRAVFGAPPSVRETLKLGRDWGWRKMVPWLLWRRFHPSRAMLLPVDLLEELSGRQRNERCRLLSRNHGSQAMMLTIICIHIEIMLVYSLIMLGLMFVPTEFLSAASKSMWETLFEDPPLWAELVWLLLYWLGMSIIEPFYIGAGFGLYLNRRTQLEAWDVELAFRQMATRLKDRP